MLTHLFGNSITQTEGHHYTKQFDECHARRNPDRYAVLSH
jgi:hypothetical protein